MTLRCKHPTHKAYRTARAALHEALQEQAVALLNLPAHDYRIEEKAESAIEALRSALSDVDIAKRAVDYHCGDGTCAVVAYR